MNISVDEEPKGTITITLWCLKGGKGRDLQAKGRKNWVLETLVGLSLNPVPAALLGRSQP